MARKQLKRLRRHYFSLMHMNFAHAIWLVNVLLIPWALLSAVAYAVLMCLHIHGITGPETQAIATGGATVTGVGTLIFAAIANHGSWSWYVSRKPFGVTQAGQMVLLSLSGNGAWIGAMILILAYSGTFVSGYAPANQAGPLVTSFLLCWLAGFFAFLLINSLAESQRKAPGKPFRGRRLLSGKEQAKRLATKKRWRIMP
jgi:hypothetical protein